MMVDYMNKTESWYQGGKAETGDLKTNNTSTTIIGESRFPDELNTKAGIKEAKQRHQQRPEKSQHLKLKLCGRKSKTSQAKKAGVPPSCVSSGCKIS